MPGELLRHGTDVCLVANSLPAINDITVDELRDVVLLAAGKCDILASALLARVKEASFGKLTVCASGSGSPCIDFRRTSQELCEAAKGADLMVLEGMGRAVHTNYAAQFQCDTLKLAMLKTRAWQSDFSTAAYTTAYASSRSTINKHLCRQNGLIINERPCIVMSVTLASSYLAS